ncbi:MAG TPA: hypothetical protein VL361_22050 [Candidatus Limnocylindrales bacterium]|nr:hypothetical protein [Candidatus Limnocylindrales bacterium]
MNTAIARTGPELIISALWKTPQPGKLESQPVHKLDGNHPFHHTLIMDNEVINYSTLGVIALPGRTHENY